MTKEKSHLPGENGIWRALGEIMDPEIPVVSLVDLGIIRQVIVDGAEIEIIFTPTFSGCPALQVMKNEIRSKMERLGFESVLVTKSLSPPWSSDWISDKAREQLKRFGLAPPMTHGGRIEIAFYEPACCPYCDSKNTSLKNAFGSTLCRSIYYCHNCRQPFEQFKAI